MNPTSDSGRVTTSDGRTNGRHRRSQPRVSSLVAALALVVGLLGHSPGAGAGPALDYLGGAQYGATLLSSHPAGFGAGFFAREFGDALPIADRLLASGKCPLVRVHLIYRSSHSYGDADIPEIIREAKRWEGLKRKHPSAVIQISPFCEHNLSAPDKYMALIQQNAPSCIPVNSPWRGSLSRKYLNEVHGSAAAAPKSGEFNFSFDGSAAVDADVEAIKKRMSKASTFFYWEPRFNGRWETDDVTPIPERRGWPEAKVVESVKVLSSPKGRTNLPARWIYKSHAENKGTGDIRAEKPVIIAPVKAAVVELRTTTGKVIETLKYYGPYVDGRSRYYGTRWGFETLKLLPAGTLAQVWVNNRKVGVVNPAFREGDYR